MFLRANDEVAGVKMRKALQELLVRSPFPALVILGDAIQVKEDSRIETMATDGRSIFWNPEWVHKKPLLSIMFDQLHEFLHIFGNHVERRGSRDLKIWRYAVDVRVAHDALALLGKNWVLDDDHIPAHPWAKNLTAEQIYDALLQNPNMRKERKDAEEGKGGKDLLPAPEMSPKQQADFLQKLGTNLSQAATSVEMAKGDLKTQIGPMLFERYKDITKNVVPWEVMLHGRIVGELGAQVSTWSPPNRRWFPRIALPSRRSVKEKELIILVDISGSINNDLLRVFRGAITSAAQRAQTSTVITFDACVREVVTTRYPDEVLRRLTFKSGAHSHTSVVEALDIVRERNPSAVACLTDGFIELPAEPYHAMHWIIPKDMGRALPWGTNYFMELTW